MIEQYVGCSDEGEDSVSRVLALVSALVIVTTAAIVRGAYSA